MMCMVNNMCNSLCISNIVAHGIIITLPIEIVPVTCGFCDCLVLNKRTLIWCCGSYNVQQSHQKIFDK